MGKQTYKQHALPLLGQHAHMAHGGPAVGAVPGGHQARQVVQHLAHAPPVQGRADHDGRAARSAGQHGAHPAASAELRARIDTGNAAARDPLKSANLDGCDALLTRRHGAQPKASTHCMPMHWCAECR